MQEACHWSQCDHWVLIPSHWQRLVSLCKWSWAVLLYSTREEHTENSVSMLEQREKWSNLECHKLSWWKKGRERKREQAGGLGDEDELFWGCRTSSRKNVLTSLVALRGSMVVEWKAGCLLITNNNKKKFCLLVSGMCPAQSHGHTVTKTTDS